MPPAAAPTPSLHMPNGNFHFVKNVEIRHSAASAENTQAPFSSMRKRTENASSVQGYTIYMHIRYMDVGIA